MEELLCEIAELVKQWEATGISSAGEILQKIAEVSTEYYYLRRLNYAIGSRPTDDHTGRPPYPPHDNTHEGIRGEGW